MDATRALRRVRVLHAYLKGLPLNPTDGLKPAYFVRSAGRADSIVNG